MDEPRVDSEAPPRLEPKRRWERPSLAFLGDLKDLVRGAGKLSGAPNDSDMLAFQKSPGQM
jgi:hypothetical protein